MPLQNRVLPTSQIVAIPARGAFTGNRGIIHGPDRVLAKRRWSHKAWICCTLDWQGRKREVMSGRKWTELFFLDEAVAMAAGHRPCAYCRRTDYNQFKDAWTQAFGRASLAPEMDDMLHAARVDPQTKRQQTSCQNVQHLPVGTFFEADGAALIVTGNAVRRFTPDGYVTADFDTRTATLVNVLTPAPLVAVLQAGYSPALHHSATV